MNTDRLTREQVLARNPGRELDALVAKKIFGVNNPDARWSPSTEISAAFEVAEEMQNNEWDFTLKNHKRLVHKRQYEAIFGTPYSAFAPTAPEAICKAALLAVMGE